MESAIASDVVTAVYAFVINASQFGKITGIVRFNNRPAEIGRWATGRNRAILRLSRDKYLQ